MSDEAIDKLETMLAEHLDRHRPGLRPYHRVITWALVSELAKRGITPSEFVAKFSPWCEPPMVVSAALDSAKLEINKLRAMFLRESRQSYKNRGPELPQERRSRPDLCPGRGPKVTCKPSQGHEARAGRKGTGGKV